MNRVLFLAALTCAGCVDPLTEVVVHTTLADLEIPAEVDAVAYRIRGASGVDLAREVSLEALPAGKRADFRFTVVHGEGLPLEGYSLRATALRGGAPLDPPLEIQLPFAFVADQTVELAVALGRRCTGGDCPPGRECQAGLCVPPMTDAGVDGSSDDLGADDLGSDDLGSDDLGSDDLGSDDLGSDDLGPLDPSDLGQDAGPPDLGPPDLGPPDLGPPDLGLDAGSPPLFMCPSSCEPCVDRTCDGARAEDCACNGRSRQCPCRFSCSPGATCGAECKDVARMCEVAAPNAGSLDMKCDETADCRVDARGAGSVDVECKRPGDCEVDCRGATDCDLRCRMGAHCLLRCDGPGCAIGRSDCDAVNCGGGVWVCNRACP